MTGLYRRRAIQLLGAGTGVTLLAGCSSSDETSQENGDGGDDSIDGDDQNVDGDLPPYATVLRETDNSDYFYGAIGFKTMESLTERDDVEEGAEPSDPLVGNPILVALLCSFGFAQLTNSKSAEAFVSNNESDGEETLLFVEGVYAFSGRYSFDGLTTDLEAAGYTTETSEDAYAVYSDPESDEIVGVSEDVFAFSSPTDDPQFDPVQAVERTVATAAGERDPKHKMDDDFASLLRTGETDDITLCLYTTDDEFDSETLSDDQPADDADELTYEFDAFARATGIHQRLSVTGDDGSAHGTAVVDYSADELVDEDLLASSLGSDADTVSIDRNGTTVTIEAAYTDGFDTN